MAVAQLDPAACGASPGRWLVACTRIELLEKNSVQDGLWRGLNFALHNGDHNALVKPNLRYPLCIFDRYAVRLFAYGGRKKCMF